MSFWSQDFDLLENKINEISNLLRVIAPKTLVERFAKIREEPDSLLSDLNTQQRCECTNRNETFDVIRVDSEECLCLAPVIAFIQGSDKVQKWLCYQIKRSLYTPDVKSRRQPKMSEYFGGACSGSKLKTNKNNEDPSIFPDCNMKCMMADWIDGPCFHLFVRRYKVNLRIHKYGYGMECRSVLGYDEQNPTIHLYYSSGYSLVIPPFSVVRHLPTKNLLSHDQMAYYKKRPPLSPETMTYYEREPPPNNTQESPPHSLRTFATSTPLPISEDLLLSSASNMTFWQSQPQVQSQQQQQQQVNQSSLFCSKMYPSPRVPDPVLQPSPVIAFSVPTQEMPLRDTQFYIGQGMSSQETSAKSSPPPPPTSTTTTSFATPLSQVNNKVPRQQLIVDS
jgi:hypothetical protein